MNVDFTYIFPLLLVLEDLWSALVAFVLASYGISRKLIRGRVSLLWICIGCLISDYFLGMLSDLMYLVEVADNRLKYISL